MFDGKTVWITGASSGIGKALVLALARKGARLVLSSRNEAALQAVADATGLAPEDCRVLPLDLAHHDDLPALAGQVIAQGGRLDYLILNGGVSQRSLALETSLEVDRRLMEVNYLGNVALTKAVLPHFVRHKSGHIVVVTSLVGKFGSPMRSGYAASKHALHGFFDSLRAEHHADGLKVTLICPGFIHTDISRNALTADGSPQQSMDEATQAGLDPDTCARRMLKAIRKGKREAYIGKREVMGVYLKRFLPGLFARIIQKARVT